MDKLNGVVLVVSCLYLGILFIRNQKKCFTEVTFVDKIFVSVLLVVTILNSLSLLKDVLFITMEADFNSLDSVNLNSVATIKIIQIFFPTFGITFIGAFLSVFLGMFFGRLLYLFHKEKIREIKDIMSIHVFVYSILFSLMFTSLVLPYLFTDLISTISGTIAVIYSAFVLTKKKLIRD